MNIVGGATRVVRKAADTTTAAAGAIGGAAVNGVIGAAQGAVSGVRQGVDKGSRSTPAALLTLGVIGATGLIEWPIVVAVGGTALLVKQFSRDGDADAGGHDEPSLQVVEDAPPKTAGRDARKTAKSAPRKTTGSRSSR